MAQWVEKKEPYVRVKEVVKTTALNPVAGQDLIIGVVIISDAGPCKPQLVSDQSEFLKYFSSQELTQDYMKTLNQLYKGSDKTLPSTMWYNAYKLAGSNTLLVCRAAKASDIYFAKPFVANSLDTYIVRDGELMKKVESFKIVVDIDGDDASHSQDGWSMNVNGVGILGNRTTDDGPQYDNYVRNLPGLVEILNETTKFFSPSYKFYSDAKATEEVDADSDNIVSVVFDEVYLGVDLLDPTDPRCEGGLQYIIICEPDWTPENPNQKVIDINSTAWSGFTPCEYYATNVYNTSTSLKVRIRRFNHDAVISKELSAAESATLNSNGKSPYTVITSVLDTFTGKGTKEPNAAILARDFYEIAVLDPSINDTPLYFNIGNIIGRGDTDQASFNDSLSMIQCLLPDDMHDLGLNYYGYDLDDAAWVEIEETEFTDLTSTIKDIQMVDNVEALKTLNPTVDGTLAIVGSDNQKFYKYTANGMNQIYVDLSIDPSKYHLLDISDSDLKKAVDEIARDEVYTVEGLCDCGNTEPSFQNYLAALAVSEEGNYFYPISPACSTNYLTIANSYARIGYDSYKLYASAPWDIDTGTFGWKVYISPAVLYWQSVSRARSNNQEFRPQFGQGVPYSYQKPMTEFNKKTRQLLLSRRINTMKWDTQISSYVMNDNFTYQTEDTIMSDDGNSRLAIRVSKAMPILLRQFLGYRINDKLYDMAYAVIDFWFKTTILSMDYSIDDYRIIIDRTNNTDEDRRANRMNVKIEIRFFRCLKYIEVVNYLFDAGMSFDE